MALAVVFILMLIVAVPSVAQAQYMDPGAASLVVQLVIAGVAGAAVLVRVYWSRLRLIVKRLFRRSP